MKTGLFHTHLYVGNSLPGAPLLTLDLLVDTVRKKVSGVARVSQSTYPPLNFQAQVWGDYSEAQLAPSADSQIILTLYGSPSGPLSEIAETFKLSGLLGADWASGFVDYQYRESQVHYVRHVAVSQSPSAPHEPVHHPMPLYAVALQQAQATGDMAQLKALVSQGEQQLAQNAALSSALTQLHAEIQRLES